MDTTIHEVSAMVAGRKLTLKTGFLAPQASAVCWAQYGDTVVFATVSLSEKAATGIDFMPLTVNVEEKFYAAGKIGGSRFIRREGRPSDSSILACRLVDRPLRPLFDKNVRNEVQIVTTIMSTDYDNQPDILAIIASSAALHLSEAPWAGPVGGVRVGLVNGELILNPNLEQLKVGDLDLVVAGTSDAVVMVEAGANQVAEDKIIDAIDFGHKAIAAITDLQEQLRQKAGKPKVTWDLAKIPAGLIDQISEQYKQKITEALFSSLSKKDKQRVVDTLKDEVIATFVVLDETNPEHSITKIHVSDAYDSIIRSITRKSIIEQGLRVDGRKTDQIRDINCQVGILPRQHGTALFTRGETQALTITTLGAPSDSQIIDGIGEEEETKKRYMHHYNAPPYSLGIVAQLRGPRRREIGHGHLAERALAPVLPTEEQFPYTLRLVSEVLSQNGSSSMASTCGSTLSLMDAGVPITAPVSGIAMGLVKEGDQVAILSDIHGWEDALGDMDFKGTGTTKGVTALQLDMKIKGISTDILRKALEQGRIGRLHILEQMIAVMPTPRAQLSPFAPRLIQLMVNPEKVGLVIGPQGKTIKKIIEETGVTIDIEDGGRIIITGTNADACALAQKRIEELTAEVEVGKIYEGKVVKVADYGAFVEILPGQTGMVHVSKWANHRVEKMQDEAKDGDIVRVKVTGIDDQDRIVLSKKDIE